MRKTIAFVVLSFAITVVPHVAAAPLNDPQNSCTGLPAIAVAPTLPPVPVTGTISYVSNRGLDPPVPQFPCPFNALGIPTWWGSQAAPCPPAVGPILGAYCGPVVLPGAFAMCMLAPIVNTVPTGLTVGFDRNGDGRITLANENNVASPLVPIGPAGQWMVPNPYGTPARVIGYPTVTVPGVALAPGDVNNVVCV